MSQENVEVVERSIDALKRADVEALTDLIDEEVVVRDHDIPDSGDYRGYTGLAQWFEDWGAAWAEWSVEPEEFIDAGDRVVAVLRLHARGLGSGVEVKRLDGAVWTLRNGKCIRVEYYNGKQQALKAVGLAE
jgi:uncharacterized protein